MDLFKKKLHRRIIWMSVFALLLVVIYLLLTFSQVLLPEVPDFVRGFQTGILVALVAALNIFIVKYGRALKHEKALKKIYIEENDERTRLIQQKISNTAMVTSICGLLLAALIAGFFDAVIFFTLLLATLFVSLVRGIYKLYYLKKY